MRPESKKQRALCEDVVFAYWDKKISRKIAVARMRELGYEPEVIDIYLDANDYEDEE